MKHYKKIIFIIVLFFICGVVHAEGNSFSTDVYYKNVCGVDFISERLPNVTSSIYEIVKTMVPIVIIVLGMFDFFKAVISQKQEESTKHTQRFIRRLTSGLLVFLIMALVEFVFTNLGTVSNYTTCMDCILNNERCGATYTVDKNVCEGYKGDECPSEVDGVKCETKTVLNATYCRSVCSDLKGRSKCESRSYCEWNNASGCGDKKERVISTLGVKTSDTVTQITEGGSPSDIIYPEGQYKYNGAVTYYKQGQSPWGSKRYGPPGADSYANAGCGPTSTAMVAATMLRNKSIFPDTVGDWMTNAGLRGTSGGTSIGAITSYLSSVGIGNSTLYSYDANKVLDAFKAGNKLVIVDVSVRDGHKSCPFTQHGHYILLTSYNNGQYNVLDPGSSKRNGFWPAGDIFNKCFIVGIIIASK